MDAGHGNDGRPFMRWLEEAVAARGTSWRQLATDSGLSHSTLSALRHRRADRPSVETCYRLSGVLNYDFRDVMRLAGYQPSEPSDVELADPELDLMFHSLLELTPEEREPVKEFVRFVLARSALRRRTKTRKAR